MKIKEVKITQKDSEKSGFSRFSNLESLIVLSIGGYLNAKKFLPIQSVEN